MRDTPLILSCLCERLIAAYHIAYHAYIAGNFRGAKYSWFLSLKILPRIFNPRIKRPCLPLSLQCKQQPRNITHEMTIILLNHEYFVPQKLPARYTVYFVPLVLMDTVTH